MEVLLTQRSRTLMMENLGFYLDATVAVNAAEGTVEWRVSERQLLTQMNRMVGSIQSLHPVVGLADFRGFSEEVEILIQRVTGLNHRDLRHWRMALELTESEQWYVMVQSQLDELKMQLSLELHHHFNEPLYAQIDASVSGGLDGATSTGGVDWLNVDPNAMLPALALNVSLETEALLSNGDLSSWDQRDQRDESLRPWMERIVQLLESQEVRIKRLEERDNSVGDGHMDPPWRPIGEVSTWSELRMPDALDIRFDSGSDALGLNGRMQLHEIMELMGRHPQLRVVCTGHTDADGRRQMNLGLSKRRSVAVRGYLLQSGVASERVLLNYFGEERAEERGALDRRVEVAFYVE